MSCLRPSCRFTESDRVPILPEEEQDDDHLPDYRYESGHDYFEARYYGSSMGRFMSPDYSDRVFGPDPVPNADITNPQSLNLYA